MTTRNVPAIKTCRRCGEDKPAEAFRPSARMKSGLESYCRACAIAKSAEWRAKNPERRKELERSRRKRTTEERWVVGLWVNYRMAEAEYWALHQAQQGLCRICEQPEVGKRGRLHVDHSHDTGRVRGLLCHHCNLALGHLRDRVDLLESAIEYLTTN